MLYFTFDIVFFFVYSFHFFVSYEFIMYSFLVFPLPFPHSYPYFCRFINYESIKGRKHFLLKNHSNANYTKLFVLNLKLPLFFSDWNTYFKFFKDSILFCILYILRPYFLGCLRLSQQNFCKTNSKTVIQFKNKNKNINKQN